MTTLVKQVDHKRVNEFAREHKKGIQAWNNMCNIYAQAVEENPEIKSVFTERFPEITEAAWSRIEAVGRGVLDVRLLVTPGKVVDAIGLLPSSVQKQVADSDFRVEVLLPSGDDHVLKHIQQLNKREISQVFSESSVRTHDEQKIWGRDNPPRIRKSVNHDRLWEIVGKRVKFPEGAVLTKKELIQIVMQLARLQSVDCISTWLA